MMSITTPQVLELGPDAFNSSTTFPASLASACWMLDARPVPGKWALPRRWTCSAEGRTGCSSTAHELQGRQPDDGASNEPPQIEAGYHGALQWDAFQPRRCESVVPDEGTARGPATELVRSRSKRRLVYSLHETIHLFWRAVDQGHSKKLQIDMSKELSLRIVVKAAQRATSQAANAWNEELVLVKPALSGGVTGARTGICTSYTNLLRLRPSIHGNRRGCTRKPHIEADAGPRHMRLEVRSKFPGFRHFRTCLFPSDSYAL
ncbi:hypothetical protein C8R46DRAFT_1327161 [Mycena filopes]|nr:hypothetical protein C8R46DRAFT_1327161 [Mycena filopes]